MLNSIVGHGDLLTNGHRAGCVELLNTIQHRVKPKYHVCGHIHEGVSIKFFFNHFIYNNIINMMLFDF